jgi:hypothetical protein
MKKTKLNKKNKSKSKLKSKFNIQKRTLKGGFFFKKNKKTYKLPSIKQQNLSVNRIPKSSPMWLPNNSPTLNEINRLSDENKKIGDFFIMYFKKNNQSFKNIEPLFLEIAEEFTKKNKKLFGEDLSDSYILWNSTVEVNNEFTEEEKNHIERQFNEFRNSYNNNQFGFNTNDTELYKDFETLKNLDNKIKKSINNDNLKSINKIQFQNLNNNLMSSLDKKISKLKKKMIDIIFKNKEFILFNLGNLNTNNKSNIIQKLNSDSRDLTLDEIKQLLQLITNN